MQQRRHDPAQYSRHGPARRVQQAATLQQRRHDPAQYSRHGPARRVRRRLTRRRRQPRPRAAAAPRARHPGPRATASPARAPRVGARRLCGDVWGTAWGPGPRPRAVLPRLRLGSTAVGDRLNFDL